MCTCSLSTIDSISSLFFGKFAGFCMPQLISSNLMSGCVLNVEDSQCFHHSKVEGTLSGFEEKWMQ